MSEWKIGYKAVSACGAAWRSWSWHLGGCVIYHPGRATWRRTGNGPLAVFDNQQDAEQFTYSNTYCGEVAVWRVLYKPSKTKRRVLWFMAATWPAWTKRKWYSLPPGTVLADAVRLVERVYTPAVKDA